MLRDMFQARSEWGDDLSSPPPPPCREGSPRSNPLGSTAPNGFVRPAPGDSPARGMTSPDHGQLLIRKGHLIGRGAFGSVYLGINVATNQLVAIKQIGVANSQPTVVRSIQRELDVMLRLPPHPNCVRYLGHKESDRHISIIMEFVSGGSVEALCKSVGHFHEATVRRYARMALKGLAHLHNFGIVHQDIKAGNVLADSEGVAKIADFGCCKDLQLLTNSLKTAGTPLWMSPEVCAGGPATKSSDMWSFGCFVLEMAKDDHLPWSGLSGTLYSVMYAIANATKPPPFPDGLSPDAVDFLSKCLAIDPLERPPADELLQHGWLTSGHDDFSTFQDNLHSATQTFISESSSGAPGGSLAVASDSESDGEGEMLRVVAAASPVSSPMGHEAPMHDEATAGTSTPETRGKAVWKTSGAVTVGSTNASPDTELLVTVQELLPADSSPSPKGRRKLGEKKSLLERIFGS